MSGGSELCVRPRCELFLSRSHVHGSRPAVVHQSSTATRGAPARSTAPTLAIGAGRNRRCGSAERTDGRPNYAKTCRNLASFVAEIAFRIEILAAIVEHPTRAGGA